MTLQPKQVGRHHKHPNAHSNAHISMCVSMQNAWGGSDLVTDGESVRQRMRGKEEDVCRAASYTDSKVGAEVKSFCVMAVDLIG